MPTGLFGKLPAAGDFVALDLAPGLRPVLDRWLTSYIVPLVQTPSAWPDGGVRGVIATARGTFVLLIEPSLDAVGRAYPLVACAQVGEADQAAADRWADAAWPVLLAATEERAPPAALRQALARIPDPHAAQDPLSPPLLWWAGTRPARPEDRLDRLAALSSG